MFDTYKIRWCSGCSIIFIVFFCRYEVVAEQKARATYEKLIDLCADDPDVIDPLKFLREREIVHFQRFGEALRGVQDKLAQKKFYMNNLNNLVDKNNRIVKLYNKYYE